MCPLRGEGVGKAWGRPYLRNFCCSEPLLVLSGALGADCLKDKPVAAALSPNKSLSDHNGGVEWRNFSFSALRITIPHV